MGIELTCGFTSHSMFPKLKETPNENLALGKYFAAVEALELYAQDNNLTSTDREVANVYLDMCVKGVAFLAYGFDHQLSLVTEDGKRLGTLTARVEAFDYRDYSKHGLVKVSVIGEDDFVKRVNSAWESAKSLGKDEVHPIRGKFAKDKLKCYGACKR
jgi:hypothetical protein